MYPTTASVSKNVYFAKVSDTLRLPPSICQKGMRCRGWRNVVTGHRNPSPRIRTRTARDRKCSHGYPAAHAIRPPCSQSLRCDKTWAGEDTCERGEDGRTNLRAPSWWFRCQAVVNTLYCVLEDVFGCSRYLERQARADSLAKAPCAPLQVHP